VTVSLDSQFHIGAVPSQAATKVIVVALAITLFVAGLVLAVGSSKVAGEPNVQYPRMVAR
jgi:hypothetical protein